MERATNMRGYIRNSKLFYASFVDKSVCPPLGFLKHLRTYNFIASGTFSSFNYIWNILQITYNLCWYCERPTPAQSPTPIYSHEPPTQPQPIHISVMNCLHPANSIANPQRPQFTLDFMQIWTTHTVSLKCILLILVRFCWFLLWFIIDSGIGLTPKTWFTQGETADWWYMECWRSVKSYIILTLSRAYTSNNTTHTIG